MSRTHSSPVARRGFLVRLSQAAAEIVASIDADCTYEPIQLRSLLALLADDVDMVVASPYHPAGSVLVTDSGYILLSMSPNPHDVRRPNVRVLVNPDGRMESEENPQMWHPMPDTETVARALRPEEHAVSTGEMLAA